MKIDFIKINGFKRLVQFSVDLDGKSLELKGKNRQGKSSVLEFIYNALTGKEFPGVPVNKECIRGGGAIGLDDGHTVTLKFDSRGGRTLVVEGPDGKPVKAPQTFLNNLLGKFTFDPFAFADAPAGEQKKALQELLKLDFSDIDVRKDAALREKREAEADAKAIEKQIEDLINIRETQRVDVADLVTKQNARAEKVRILDGARNTMKTVETQIDAVTAKITGLGLEIEELKRQLADAEKEKLEVSARAIRGREVISQLETEVAAMPDNSEAIVSADETNEKASAWERKESLRAEHALAVSDIDAAKQKLEDIENDRKERLLSAKFPIEGLEFTEDGVLFNGLPFNARNQSKSDIIRVGVAISIAQNPNLRIASIKDGALLDSESKADVLRILHENGFQAFIETVTDTELQALTIEEVPA